MVDKMMCLGGMYASSIKILVYNGPESYWWSVEYLIPQNKLVQFCSAYITQPRVTLGPVFL